jgi:hypothetical protein
MDKMDEIQSKPKKILPLPKIEQTINEILTPSSFGLETNVRTRSYRIKVDIENIPI